MSSVTRPPPSHRLPSPRTSRASASVLLPTHFPLPPRLSSLSRSSLSPFAPPREPSRRWSGTPGAGIQGLNVKPPAASVALLLLSSPLFLLCCLSFSLRCLCYPPTLLSSLLLSCFCIQINLPPDMTIILPGKKQILPSSLCSLRL